MLAGNRVWKAFKTRAEAISFAEQLRSQRTNEGNVAFALSSNKRVEAMQCIEPLRQHDRTLGDATNYFLKHVEAFRKAPIVSEIFARMIAEATAAGRRDRTLKELQHRLGIFSQLTCPHQLDNALFES